MMKLWKAFEWWYKVRPSILLIRSLLYIGLWTFLAYALVSTNPWLALVGGLVLGWCVIDLLLLGFFMFMNYAFHSSIFEERD